MTHEIKIFKDTVAVFDLETTGTEVDKARIVSIAISYLFPDGRREDKYSLINPGIPIPKEASDVHGITDEMVKDSPRFAQIAKSLLDKLNGVSLAGYNVLNYDIPLLAEEFARCGLDWNLQGVKVYDAMGIFKNMERRRLEDAVKFYCGREITGAHNAAGDVESTIDVLAAQIEKYGLDTPEAVELHGRGSWEKDELVMANIYDPAGKLYVDSDGDVCYNFGKAKDVKVKNDPGFGSWMLKQDFIPLVTKRMLNSYMRSI